MGGLSEIPQLANGRAAIQTQIRLPKSKAGAQSLVRPSTPVSSVFVPCPDLKDTTCLLVAHVQEDEASLTRQPWGHLGDSLS